MYAPFSGVGGLVYDQDAVYIDLGGSHSHASAPVQGERSAKGEGPGPSFVEELRDLKTTLDMKMESAGLQLFSASEAMTGAEMEVDPEQDDEDEDDENQDNDQEEVTEDKINRKFTPIVATDDGRIRRRVVFNDDEEEEDVTEIISKEIASLRAEATESGNVSKRKIYEDDFDDSGQEDENNSEDEESEDEEAPGKKKSQTKRTTTQSTPTDDSISSLVSRIKSKVQGGGAPSSQSHSKGATIKMATPQQVEFDEEEDDASESEDDEQDPPSDQEDDLDDDLSLDEDDDEEMETQDSEDEVVVKPKVGGGSVESSLEREKAARLSLAEESFYSRFHHRSIQKMIYDDTDDYLNVSSKADFDSANFSQSQPGEGDATSLKQLFIGGDYADTAQKLLDADDQDGGDSDEEFGDFEELDAEPALEAPKKGKKVRGGGGEELSQKSREELKKKLKEKFDMDYDGGGAGEGEEGGDKSFYKDWKAQVDEQSKVGVANFTP